MGVIGQAVEVAERTQVAEARRTAVELGRLAGLPERRQDELAIVVTELAGNIVRHAGRGTVLLHHGGGAVEVLALDRGPGIRDIAGALRDGTSTEAGGPGLGLGAVRRLSDEWDLHSAPQHGTAVLARFLTGEGRPSLHGIRLGAVELPHPSEHVSGDALALLPRPGGARLAVVDGLGHGPDAAAASRAALGVLEGLGEGVGPSEALRAMDVALRDLRGAAASIVDLDVVGRKVVAAGAGNVAMTLAGPRRMRSLTNTHATLGAGVSGLLTETTEEWPEDALVVVQSDGTSARWDAAAYPGLLRRHPALVAGLLWRDHGGRRDDVTVAVAGRETAA